jgi:ParB-like chromosome segregation protein Spo0J
LRSHPLADLFPLLEGADFDALVADIKANGQREAIMLFEDKILDGRNRWHACKKAGIEPKTKEYRGNDPLAYVISLNLKRRHLNESQRAIVAAKIATLPDGIRADRQGAQIQAPTQSDAANMLNVGRSSVQAARIVLDKGSPELRHAVEQGHIAVSAAAQATKLSSEHQKRVVEEAAAGTSNPVKKVVIEAKREDYDRRAERGGTVTDLDALIASGKKFGAILADPPWLFHTYSGKGKQRSAERYYDPMTLEAIKMLPIEKLAAKDCALFLWGVWEETPGALDVIRAWGFEFKSLAFNWVKENKSGDGLFMSLGYWTRAGSEPCWLATRGSPMRLDMGVR